MSNKLRYSLGYRLFLAVFLFGFAITFLLTGIELYLDYRNDIRSVENHFTEIKKVQLQSITESLWVMDKEQLQIQMNGLLNIPHIKYARIQFNDRLIASAGSPQTKQAINREIPLFYTFDNKHIYIGTLFMSASLKDIYGDLQGRFLKGFLIEGFHVFLISLFISVLFHFYVTRHLTAMADYFRESSPWKSDKPLLLQGRSPSGAGRDEIHQVVTAINTMSANMRNAFQELDTELQKRRQTEEALAAEKERLAVTLRSIGDGVITTDTEGRTVLINKVAEELTGWTHEEAVGKPLEQVFHIINEQTREQCENPAQKVVLSGGVVNLANHTVLVARDGTERIIADSGAPIFDMTSKLIGVVLVFRDITEKERMQKEALKAQKLESLGILAGGIAHDFNNLLTAILGNISLAKMFAQPQDKIYDKLTEAEKASYRAKDLTQQLLTFSKGGAPIKKVTTIADFIRDSARFILSGSKTSCRFDIADDLSPTEVDEGQISQVISNLILNAEHAMPGGGTIDVTCRNVLIDKENVVSLRKGKYLQLSVKDHGKGITKEHLQKIFDPYFTTKEEGRGLGLATVYSIIKNHNGHITVESALGEGTTFTIYLPASESEVPAKKTAVVPMKGKGKVLVMDDEEIIRELAGAILKELGYEAEFAADGAVAIEIYRKALTSARPFDLVLMDLTVPGGMGGKETIKKLLEIDPGAKAIVSSGYSTDPVMADFKKYGFKDVIAKPYKIQELSRALHEVISQC